MVVALKILHIAFAAAWFGHKLLIPGDIKASVRLDGAGGLDFLARLKRAERMGILSGLGTLAAGVGLAYAVGLDTVSTGVWVGATLVVVAMVVGGMLGRPATRSLRRAVETHDRVAATVAGQRVNRVLAMESLLWLGALTAMLV